MWRQLSCLWHYLYIIYFSNERPKYKLMETDNLIFLTLLGWGLVEFRCTVFPRIVSHVTLNETKRIWKIHFSKKMRDI